MTTRRLITGFFVLYALLIPVLAQEFVNQNPSAATALIGCGIIIAFLFWSGRAFFLNLLIAFYVFQNYLLLPYASIFEGGLSLESQHALWLYGGLAMYFTPDATALVYWNLFLLLSSWSIGLLLLRTPDRGKPVSVPRVFRALDGTMLRNGLPFVAGNVLLFVLNYQSPEAGLRATMTGESQPLFLFGLASLGTINLVCLVFFLRELSSGLRRPQYLLLFPPLLAVGIGMLSGSRSTAFHFLVVGLIYWLLLQSDHKWKWSTLIKAGLVSAALMIISIGVALFAQVLRPLYRYSNSFNFADIAEAFRFTAVVDTRDVLLQGITQLLFRLTNLKAQFYILNDWYVHEPWQHYNPATTVMRTINDLVPGDVFPNVLSINQLFDYIYHGITINYNSEMWGIQSTLYLYFGHFGSAVVVLALAVILSQGYPPIMSVVRASPALATLVIQLVLDIMTNGTMERVIPVNLVRPLVGFVIFILIYKSFSLILPNRIRFWSPVRSFP